MARLLLQHTSGNKAWCEEHLEDLLHLVVGVGQTGTVERILEMMPVD